jgi:hypothetical protein
MRVVLLHHFPLEHGSAGDLVRQWATDLQAAGHSVRVLIVDSHGPTSADTIDRVVCDPGDATADLPFAVPSFGGSHVGGPAKNATSGWQSGLTFHGLSDEQLSAYRDVQRDRLDAIIDEFDPHVIHAQHVWVQGQLALETGVPYLLNAWGAELDEGRADERYRMLAAQAAENAGRILVADPTLAQQIVKLFEIGPERTLVMPPDWVPSDAGSGPASEQRGAALAALYHMVYDERFGPLE